MTPETSEVFDRLAAAVIDLLQTEEVRYANAGERQIVSELFARLRPLFPDWTVSNEYDRREQQQKRLRHRSPRSGVEKEAPITPDIVVHQVGKKENLLVIEVKRHTNKDYERDVWKLSGMTALSGEFGYALGVHLILKVKEGAVAGCDVYVDGITNADLTAELAAKLPR